jgi:DNA polymerase-3 subunit epsilon
VIDIAVVAADGRVLLDTLVRPTQPIPAAASRVNGIRDADVGTAPHWLDVHAVLVPLLEARRVIVYNAAFDRRMVAQTCGRHDLRVPDAMWDCAMLGYARFRGEMNASQRGYRWHRLDHAVLSFGATPGGHRALGDALACRQVVAGMANAFVV